MNRLIAVVGMCGSGKSIACDVLKDFGWNYIRFGQLTIDRLKQEGRAITEENEKKIREELRKKHGMGAFALLLLPRIEQAVTEGDTVIDGLYSWSEYKILKERFGDDLSVVHVYASPRTRYERLRNRDHHADDSEHRMRMLTPAEARQRDYAEIENIEKGGPIAMADRTVINEDDLDYLRGEIRNIILGDT